MRIAQNSGKMESRWACPPSPEEDVGDVVVVDDGMRAPSELASRRFG